MKIEIATARIDPAHGIDREATLFVPRPIAAIGAARPVAPAPLIDARGLVVAPVHRPRPAARTRSSTRPRSNRRWRPRRRRVTAPCRPTRSTARRPGLVQMLKHRARRSTGRVYRSAAHGQCRAPLDRDGELRERVRCVSPADVPLSTPNSWRRAIRVDLRPPLVGPSERSQTFEGVRTTGSARAASPHPTPGDVALGPPSLAAERVRSSSGCRRRSVARFAAAKQEACRSPRLAVLTAPLHVDIAGSPPIAPVPPRSRQNRDAPRCARSEDGTSISCAPSAPATTTASRYSSAKLAGRDGLALLLPLHLKWRPRRARTKRPSQDQSEPRAHRRGAAIAPRQAPTLRLRSQYVEKVGERAGEARAKHAFLGGVQGGPVYLRRDNRPRNQGARRAHLLM